MHTGELFNFFVLNAIIIKCNFHSTSSHVVFFITNDGGLHF